MKCYYHSTTNTSTSCDRCNRPICLDCIIQFKTPKKYRSVDDQIDRRNYLEQLDEEVQLEELTWCLPCYYTHFNHDLSKSEQLSTKIVSILVELVAYSIVIVALLAIGNIELKLNMDLNQFISPLMLLLWIILYLFLFIMLFNYRNKQLKLKREKLEEVKQKFLSITNIGTIYLPIDCFYCKNEIDPESFACLNLDCTLGEELSKDAEEIPIDPVNSNYGFFNTLKKLPKFPPQEDKNNNENNKPKSEL